jgi:hypothetical protein
MDARRFDRLAKLMATPSSRRRMLARLGASVVGGRAAVHVGPATAEGAGCQRPADQCEDACCRAGRERCCDGVCTAVLDDPANCGACGNACPDGKACVGGRCLRCPRGARRCGHGCTEFILSGGASPSETIGVDDDLTVYLNGAPIFVNDDGVATELPPIRFPAQHGDLLRVVATDVDPYCRGIDPLYLHCAPTGAVQVLDADGQSDGCQFPITRPPNFVFYDQTFAIQLG